MKSVEQQLGEEKKVNQAIVDLLDEALQKVGYSEYVINGLTISGKIDFLVRAAQQSVNSDEAAARAAIRRDWERSIYKEHYEGQE